MIVYDRSGMALVLTLLAVSFLVAVTVQLGTSVNQQMHSAANQGKIVQLDAILLSGLNLARAALLADQQKNNYDSSFDDWGEFEQDTLAAIFSEGALEIKVTDLSGLLQVNALVLTEGEKKRRKEEEKSGNQGENSGGTGAEGASSVNPEKNQRDLWKRFLQSDNFVIEDEDAAQELIDCLVDWLDKDDEEHENGAERGYYSSRDPSYIPANGPIMFPEELLLVKGWNKELLYGEKEHSGIIDYLTIAGQDGKININTAPTLVLQALHDDMTKELAAVLVDFRSEEENRDQLENQNWYSNVSGFTGTGITFEKDLIAISSSYFLVTITARIDRLQRTGNGVIHRKENSEQALLYWKVE